MRLRTFAPLVPFCLALALLATGGRAEPAGSGSGSPHAKKKVKPAPPPLPDGGLPEGAVQVHLEVGQSYPLAIPGGTQVICDDPSVAKSEFGDSAIVLRAEGPGATLCGARLAGAPKGLWYVVVVEAK